MLLPRASHWPRLINMIAFIAVLGVVLFFVAESGVLPPKGSLSDTDSIGAEPQDTVHENPVSEDPPPEIFSDTILIKLAPSAASAVTADGKISALGSKDLSLLNTELRSAGMLSMEPLLSKARKKKLRSISPVRIGKKAPADALALLRSQDELSQWQRVRLVSRAKRKRLGEKDEGYSAIQRTIQKLRKNPNVLIAEPNYAVHAFAVPNDPYFASSGAWGQSYDDLWGLKKTNAVGAWDITTGSEDIVVAVIDTGVDRSHPDLSANMWTNSGEIPGNGVDDDGNTYIDDVRGWDWVGADSDPMDDMGHGTHVAGTIAAVGNNALGVTGMSWKSKIMALKFLDAGGGGDLADGIAAMMYAADMGADVINSSWGCACNSAMMDDAVKYAHAKGAVVVTAAGNDARDALTFSPASADDTITVGATNVNDASACFSNFGPKIDVTAPGGDADRCGGIQDFILSLRASNNPMCPAGATVGGQYCIARGTSMAAPHVSGLAALVLSANPALTNEEVRQILRLSVDDLGASGRDDTFGYGRINAQKAVQLALQPLPLSPIMTSPASRSLLTSATLPVTGSVSGAGFARYFVELGRGSAPTEWTLLAASTVQPVQDGVLAQLDSSALQDGTYTIRLSAENTAGVVTHFQVFDLEVDLFDEEIQSPAGLIPLSTIEIHGSAETRNGMPFGNYALEWGQGQSPASWSTEGISLMNGGTVSRADGLLGTWDTSSFQSGKYSLRLTVTSATGRLAQVVSVVAVDPDILPGWPKTFWWGSGVVSYKPQPLPSFVDLDGDGNKEVIYVWPDGKVHAYRQDGSAVPGFPFAVQEGDDGLNFGVNAVDLDGNGTEEIIATSKKYIYIIRNDGSAYPGWSDRKLSLQQNAYDSTPGIADLDQDGVQEIVVREYFTQTDRSELTLHAFRLDGTEADGFPRTILFPPTAVSNAPDTIWPSLHGAPSISDLDGDGKSEILFAIADRIFVTDHHGAVLSGWPVIVPKAANGGPMLFEGALASGDIDGDGMREITGIARRAKCGGAGCPVRVYAFRMDGSLLPGWPKTNEQDEFMIDLTSRHMNTPTLCDLDGDGKDEVATGLNRLFIFDDQDLSWNDRAIAANTQPVVARLRGDSQPDFALVTYNSLQVIDRFASDSWRKILNSPTYFNGPPVVADMDGDGMAEMAAIDAPNTMAPGLYSAYLWRIPGSSIASADEWTMFSHDPAHSGNGSGPLRLCGNGRIDVQSACYRGEACDDGDGEEGDGCSAACDVEPGWMCNGEPSVCGIDLAPRVRQLMGLGETEIPTVLQRLQFLSAMFHAEESGDLRFDTDANGSIDRADTRMLLDALLRIMSGA
ncbi:MAG: S8 family serine peptidase [Candidatus Peregrinibacteria bacterium]